MAERRFAEVVRVLNKSIFPPYVVECIARFEGWGPVLGNFKSEEKEALKVGDFVDVQTEPGFYTLCYIVAQNGPHWTIRTDGGMEHLEINCHAIDMTQYGAISERPITRESMKDVSTGSLVMIQTNNGWEKGMVAEKIKGQLMIQYPHYLNLQPKPGDVVQKVWLHADEKARVKRWLHQAKKAVNKAGEMVGHAVGATEKVWNTLDEQFDLEDKLEKIGGRTERALSWAEKHFYTMVNKISPNTQKQLVNVLPVLDATNNALQIHQAYQGINAAIAEKGVEATVAEMTMAAQTGAMYVGGAVIIRPKAALNYPSTKNRDKCLSVCLSVCLSQICAGFM